MKKVFWVSEFTPFKISNQRKASIKKYFIEGIELLQNYDLIEDNYKYMFQGKIYKTLKLDVKNISEGFILYEKLNIWFWFNYGIRPVELYLIHFIIIKS